MNSFSEKNQSQSSVIAKLQQQMHEKDRDIQKLEHQAENLRLDLEQKVKELAFNQEAFTHQSGLMKNKLDHHKQMHTKVQEDTDITLAKHQKEMAIMEQQLQIANNKNLDLKQELEKNIQQFQEAVGK